MNCENCNIEHDGSYGSGRFCTVKCSRGFSTKNKRDEINEKVSSKLTGRKGHDKGFRKGFDPNRKIFTEEQRLKGSRVNAEKRKTWKDSAKFEDLLTKGLRKEFILKEQDLKCIECGLIEWNGKKITLELDHIDGITTNNSRENLRCLCPNCHSQTPTFRRRKYRSLSSIV